MLVLISTGCSAEYRAYFTADKVDEEVIINGNSEYFTKQSAFYDDTGATLTDDAVEGKEYYKMEKGSNVINYSYSFNFNDYKRSRAVNSCTPGINIDKLGEDYTISTGNNYSCFGYFDEMDNLKISLIFDPDFYKITNNNADEVTGNTYVWKINRENYNNKSISISYQKVKDVESSKREEKAQKDTTRLYIICASVLVGAIIVGFIVKIKFKRL